MYLSSCMLLLSDNIFVRLDLILEGKQVLKPEK